MPKIIATALVSVFITRCLTQKKCKELLVKLDRIHAVELMEHHSKTFGMGWEGGYREGVKNAQYFGARYEDL